MKKSLLVAISLSAVALHAQQTAPGQQLPAKLQSQAASNIYVLEDAGNKPLTGPFVPAKIHTKKAAVTTIEVGNTSYDLQTNASVGNRIYVYPNGKVSVVWTTSPDGVSEFPARGSGYNHFDGSLWGSSSNTRIESARTGWPNINVLANGNELVVAHVATSSGGLKFTTNTGAGSSTWTTSATKLTYGNGGRPIWARVANKGDILHVLQNFADSAEAGDPANIRINGMLLPTLYSRSTDAGATWTNTQEFLPGYDTSRTTRGSGDAYAVVASGSNVVISIADNLGGDVSIWKSINDGATFTKTTVDTFPYSPYDDAHFPNIPDTPFTNDGSVDMAFDNNGNVHVVYGIGRVFKTDPDSSFFLPATSGIVYWNESNNQKLIVGRVNDRNNNDTMDLEVGTWLALNNKALPNITGEDGNPRPANAVARYGNLSLTTHPSIAIDAQNRIYVVYDAPVEQDVYLDDVNYRDIYVVYSTNGGTSWSNPQNISKGIAQEDVFGCVAKRVDNFLHLIWQKDDIPGTNLQNNSNSNSHPITENKILYAAIPVTEILGDQIGGDPAIPNGIFDDNNGKSGLVYAAELYPNPAIITTTAMIYVNRDLDVNYEIYNIAGQKMAAKELGHLGVGNHEITIPVTNLARGIYMVKFNAEGSSVTKKLIVD